MHVTQRDATKTVARRLREYNRRIGDRQDTAAPGAAHTAVLPFYGDANTCWTGNDKSISRRSSESENSILAAVAARQQNFNEDTDDVSTSTSQLSDLPSIVPFCLATDVSTPPSSDDGSDDGDLDWSSALLANESYQWKSRVWSATDSRAFLAGIANEGGRTRQSTRFPSLVALHEHAQSKHATSEASVIAKGNHSPPRGDKRAAKVIARPPSPPWLPDDVQETLPFFRLLDTIESKPQTGWTAEMASRATQHRYSRPDDWASAKANGGGYNAFGNINAELMDNLRAVLCHPQGFSGRVAEAAISRKQLEMDAANEMIDDIWFEPTLQALDGWDELYASGSCGAEESEKSANSSSSDLLGEYPEADSHWSAAAMGTRDSSVDRDQCMTQEEDPGDKGEQRSEEMPCQNPREVGKRVNTETGFAAKKTCVDDKLAQALQEFQLFTGLRISI